VQCSRSARAHDIGRLAHSGPAGNLARTSLGRNCSRLRFLVQWSETCTPCQGGFQAGFQGDFAAGTARLVVLDRGSSADTPAVVVPICASASLSSESLVDGRRFCQNACRQIGQDPRTRAPVYQESQISKTHA
jgi:hypothetical protein